MVNPTSSLQTHPVGSEFNHQWAAELGRQVAAPPEEGGEASPPLLHPSERRHSPVVTRLPPRGQDHEVLGLGVAAQGRADNVVDGVILVYLLHQLHTPVGRLESGPGSHCRSQWENSSARTLQITAL